jgi:5-methylcytosine-specific restriction endonuclease McrA
LYRQANSEKIKKTKQAYNRANAKEIALNAKNWHEKNRAKTLLDQRKWHAANPNYRSFATQKRRALKKNNGVFAVTSVELAKLRASPCTYCGAPSQHIDHIVPISRGGSHSIGNLTGACAACNLSKGAKFITEWKKGNNAKPSENN